MTLPIERARSRRPVTWLTVIGVLLLPVVIGGILVAALYNPTERLDAMSTAIVNNDEPVTIDGQYVPLGRQLTAGLVEGSDEQPSNLTWTISNDDDAAAGLEDGTYDAVVTIPANFSAAATSTAPGGTPEQATIAVRTAPDSLIVDDAITAQVTQAAATLMGRQLSSVYLENVFLGFTTLGDQLGEAADGARQLADGAGEAATGARTWSDGAGDAADGATQLASGAAQLASGTSATADGLARWASGAGGVADGTAKLADGLQQMADQVAQLPAVPQQIVDGAKALAENSTQLKAAVSDAATRLADLSSTCVADGGSTELCAALADISQRTGDALPTITGAIDQSGALATQVEQLAQFGPQLTQALQASAAGASSLAGGMTELADGAAKSAGGARQLADGMSSASTGAAALADGVGQLATGADALAGGVDQIADGTGTLADGLATASESLPSYTDDEATDLASVVANPVAADGLGSSIFGASAVPLLATLALWFGGLASFVVLQAVPRHALTSRRPSVLLALRNLAPAAGIGALQGLLVAGVVQIAANYAWGTWTAFAGLAMVAGVAFAAVNQALVAVFGGAGRWISALVGVLAVATGVVSTVPGVLASIAGLMPTTPAYNALLAALTPAGGIAAGTVGMLVWAGLAFAATIIAVARRRTTSARAVLLASPAVA